MALSTIDTSSISGLGYGFKNRIINGAMVIDQRNAGASITPLTSGTWYATDRFNINVTQSSKFTSQQSSTAPTGFSNSILITSSSAYSVLTGDAFTIRQNIEGYNFADLAWGTASAATVTLSFWVRSSLTGTFGGSFQNSDSSRSYPFSYTINAANTWEQKTVTVAGDTSGTWVGATNGRGVTLYFSLGTGATYSGAAGSWSSNNYQSATGATSVVGTSGATFYITGVQLEKGSTATSFDYRPYGTELALCQRYYALSYNIGVDKPGTVTTGGELRFYAPAAGGESAPTVFFPVTMRTTPTVTWYSPATGASGNARNYSTGTDIAWNAYNTGGYKSFSGGPGQTATSIVGYQYTLSAEL